MLRVLVVEECASVISTLMNYLDFLDMVYTSYEVKKTVCTIHPRAACLPTSMSFHQLVCILQGFRREYDFFHCSGWFSALAAYMAEVPYGVHFHGNDIREWKRSHDLWQLARKFVDYRVLKQAEYVVVSTPDLIKYIKPLRPDAFFMPNPIDFNVFNPSASKIQLREDLPVFLSPHRLNHTKGHELIWKAISETKNDFVLLQPDWGWEPYWSRLKKNAPKKVKFIPLIPRLKIASYYVSVHGVIGQMNLGSIGMCELESVACEIPVLCYTHDDSPFVPKSKDPTILARYIDDLIENIRFRRRLIREELTFVKKRHDAKIVSEIWKEIWETIRDSGAKMIHDVIIPNIWRKTYFLSHHLTKMMHGI